MGVASRPPPLLFTGNQVLVYRHSRSRWHRKVDRRRDSAGSRGCLQQLNEQGQPAPLPGPDSKWAEERSMDKAPARPVAAAAVSDRGD